MTKTYKLTSEKLAEIKAELTYLKTVREKEVAELIREARSFGDLSENSEYDEAKNEQGRLFSKMLELENIISHAELIDENVIVGDVVSMGHRVLVLDIENNEEEEYQIVGSREAEPGKGYISDESPLGRSLIGKKIGDEIEYEAPIGTIRYRVEKIL